MKDFQKELTYLEKYLKETGNNQEIDYDKVAKVRGMDIVIVTTANSDKEAYALLEKIGMPFRK